MHHIEKSIRPEQLSNTVMHVETQWAVEITYLLYER